MPSFTFTVPGPASTPAVDPDAPIAHVGAAVDRLYEQFKDRTNVIAALTAFATPAQGVETAYQDLYTLRSVDTATGVTLDAIGDIVGQLRGGLADADYRRFIRARISANRSRGTAESILRVITLVIDDPAAYLELDMQGVASYVLRILNVQIDADVADIAAEFLRDSTSAGVRGILETADIAPASLLVLDVGQLDVKAFANAQE